MKNPRGSWKSSLLLVILWSNFIFLWTRVYYITTASDVTDSVNYLGGLITAYGLIVVAWIYHNVRIYQKKGPRATSRVIPVRDTHDVLNRRISRRAELMTDQEIEVKIVAGTKVFVHKSPPPPEPAIPSRQEVLIH